MTLAAEPTANLNKKSLFLNYYKIKFDSYLFSRGLHFNVIAPRLILIKTITGFHWPFSCFQTYAFRSAPHEAIWLDFGAQSIPVT